MLIDRNYLIATFVLLLILIVVQGQIILDTAATIRKVAPTPTAAATPTLRTDIWPPELAALVPPGHSVRKLYTTEEIKVGDRWFILAGYNKDGTRAVWVYDLKPLPPGVHDYKNVGGTLDEPLLISFEVTQVGEKFFLKPGAVPLWLLVDEAP